MISPVLPLILAISGLAGPHTAGVAVLPAQAEGALYRVVTAQAAPGKLLELIELHREHMTLLEQVGDARPYWMRHTQGDRWDLLILYPMGSFGEYYSASRVADRHRARSSSGRTGAELEQAIAETTAWREELFVRGPELDDVRQAFDGAGFFHVEMFVALAGKRAALLMEREMENTYLEALGRPQNLIFVREAGAAWDSFTIGFYRDLKHYAESADISDEEEDRAARTAGFEGASRIGAYLRTLIALHHDTLAVAIP
jgi:hypothetical protein